MPQLKDTDWMNVFRNKTHVYATRDTLQTERHRLKEDGKRCSIQTEWKESRGNTTHISKTDFKTKTVTKGKEGHHIILRGSTQKQEIILINIYMYLT